MQDLDTQATPAAVNETKPGILDGGPWKHVIDRYQAGESVRLTELSDAASEMRGRGLTNLQIGNLFGVAKDTIAINLGAQFNALQKLVPFARKLLDRSPHIPLRDAVRIACIKDREQQIASMEKAAATRPNDAPKKRGKGQAFHHSPRRR